MKSIKQILSETRELSTQDKTKVSSLVDLGLLAEDKFQLAKRALTVNPELLSEAEKNVLQDITNDLLDLVNEGKKSVSDSNIPNMIILKRTTIRAYPDNTRVAMYYSPTLDKHISIPFGPKGAKDDPIIAEKNSQFTGADDDYIKHAPASVQLAYRRHKNARTPDVSKVRDKVMSSASDDELKHITGGGEELKKRYSSQTLEKSNLNRTIARIGIGINHAITSRGADKRAAKDIETADKAAAKAKVASDAQEKQNKKDAITQKLKTSKKKLTPTVRPRQQPPMPKTPGVRPPPALAEGEIDEGIVDSIKVGAKRIYRNVKRTIKKAVDAVSSDSSDNKSSVPTSADTAEDQRQMRLRRQAATVSNPYNRRVSVDQHMVRQNKASYGSDPYGRQMNETNNLELIKRIAEDRKQTAEINFGDKTIPINYGIAKKFITIYESLNISNKKKIESMLNENFNTCSKAISFTIRQ